MKAKGTTSSEKEIIKQLKGAQCFVGYCQQVGKVFWEEKNFLDNYVYRFVTIRNINIPKKPTRESKTNIHDRPERMLKINFSKHIQFDSLIGRI